MADLLPGQKVAQIGRAEGLRQPGDEIENKKMIRSTDATDILNQHATGAYERVKRSYIQANAQKHSPINPSTSVTSSAPHRSPAASLGGNRTNSPRVNPVIARLLAQSLALGLGAGGFLAIGGIP